MLTVIPETFKPSIKMSYAEAAAKGPSQPLEEVSNPHHYLSNLSYHL
jgi:hypothetical protein